MMFRFKQFTVEQVPGVMKVGTDGCLLGAWARGGSNILDIGTGTGVIALMMAQRCPSAFVTAIDCNRDAVRLAARNLSSRGQNAIVSTHHVALQDFKSPRPFDSIVSNPPFFVDSLACPDGQRDMARHARTLTYEDLMNHSARLLADNGELSVIIPFDYRRRMESAATLAGLFPTRVCGVKTSAHKPVRRYLLAFGKHPTEVEHTELLIGSPAYQDLLRDFYLNL